MNALILAVPDLNWNADSISTALTSRGARIRVAEAANRVLVGFVLARRILDLLEIDLIGVHPDYRRRGVARSMLGDLIATEASDELGEARLELAASNGPARGLYAALDFMVVGRRKRYYPNGDDALLLSRSVDRARSRAPQ